MELTRKGHPSSRIVLGEGATWIERHAAGELQRYCRSISGATLPISSNGTGAGPTIAIGRAETNPVVRAAVESGSIRLSADHPGLDGFIAVTARLHGDDLLVLGGSQDRSTLYAVYWLVEEVLGAGFFRDGERLPAARDLEVPQQFVEMRPHFADRQDGSGCIFRYSCSGWDFEDWQRELDWKVKRRVNMHCGFDVGADITSGILADWGAPVERQLPPGEPTLHERAHQYARSLGMRVICNVPLPQLPEGFAAWFPKCRTMLLQWSELAPYRTLHPADPLFREFVMQYVSRYQQRYGCDHLYFAEFASESAILQGADSIPEARLAFARAMSDALRAVDPEAVWMPSTWAFDLDAEGGKRWTPQDVRQYLDAISIPHVVSDLWAEERAKYLQLDYLFGHPWAFGVLHSFGAGSFLHGDVPGLVRQVQGLLENPKAAGCTAFHIQSEQIDCNGFYYELCAKLAWDPGATTVDGYLREYCSKRYGNSGRALEDAWWLLVETVYGPESGTVASILDPLYWYRPDLHLLFGRTTPDAKTAALRARRAAVVPKLRRCVELFLGERGVLDTNTMALRDAVDVARLWVAERFNLSLIAARDAFLAANREDFDRSALACRQLLKDQARLLASWPPYRLDRKIEQHRRIYGDGAAHWVKHVHVWVLEDEARESVPLRDYYRMDLDGLVADYYAPRISAYLDLLAARLERGPREIVDAELDAAFAPIERAFIEQPTLPKPAGEHPQEVMMELLADDRG